MNINMIDFEDIKKVWDKQKGETMFTIDEASLHKGITRKKDAAMKKINRNEISVSLINGIVSIVMLVAALQGQHNWAFLSSGLMAATVIYIQYFRRKRKQTENMFDRSMLGELDHAISNAKSIIRFNYLMVIGFLLPLFVIYFSKMIVESAGWEKWIITTGALLFALYLSRWEQKSCNMPRKEHLLNLKNKLIEE
jgi:hypothetical protein